MRFDRMDCEFFPKLLFIDRGVIVNAYGSDHDSRGCSKSLLRLFDAHNPKHVIPAEPKSVHSRSTKSYEK